MNRCPSDLGLKDADKCLECQDCWEKALAEHDAEIINRFAKEVVQFLDFNCYDVSTSDCDKYDSCAKCKLEWLYKKLEQTKGKKK